MAVIVWRTKAHLTQSSTIYFRNERISANAIQFLAFLPTLLTFSSSVCSTFILKLFDSTVKKALLT